MLQMVKIRHRIYKQTTYSPNKLFMKQNKQKKTNNFFECVPVITSVFLCFGVFRYFYEPTNYLKFKVKIKVSRPEKHMITILYYYLG